MSSRPRRWTVILLSVLILGNYCIPLGGEAIGSVCGSSGNRHATAEVLVLDGGDGSPPDRFAIDKLPAC